MTARVAAELSISRQSQAAPEVTSLPDDDIDTLFTVAPDEFTAARDALVKRLRAAGEREDAKAVAGLRRPKLAAWAVNEVVRADPAAVAALLATGAAVRDQQRRALSGVKAPQLRAASAARRAAVGRLVAAAVAVLERQGGSQAHVAQVTATWEAASADEEAARQVLAGRLSSPLSPPSGFGELSPLGLVADADADEVDRTEPSAPASAAPSGYLRGRKEARREQRDQRQPRAEQAELQREERAQQQRSQLRARRRGARAALEQARAAADEAEAARTRAHDEAQASTRAAEAAGKAAEESRTAAVAARRDADRLRSAFEEAGARAEGAQAALEVKEQEAVAARRRAEEAARVLEGLA